MAESNAAWVRDMTALTEDTIVFVVLETCSALESVLLERIVETRVWIVSIRWEVWSSRNGCEGFD